MPPRPSPGVLLPRRAISDNSFYDQGMTTQPVATGPRGGPRAERSRASRLPGRASRRGGCADDRPGDCWIRRVLLGVRPSPSARCRVVVRTSARRERRRLVGRVVDRAAASQVLLRAADHRDRARKSRSWQRWLRTDRRAARTDVVDPRRRHRANEREARIGLDRAASRGAGATRAGVRANRDTAAAGLGRRCAVGDDCAVRTRVGDVAVAVVSFLALLSYLIAPADHDRRRRRHLHRRSSMGPKRYFAAATLAASASSSAYSAGGVLRHRCGSTPR